jgi:hypothetical protein
MKQEKPLFEVKDLSGMLSRAKKVATEDATVEECKGKGVQPIEEHRIQMT